MKNTAYISGFDAWKNAKPGVHYTNYVPKWINDDKDLMEQFYNGWKNAARNSGK